MTAEQRQEIRAISPWFDRAAAAVYLCCSVWQVDRFVGEGKLKGRYPSTRPLFHRDLVNDSPIHPATRRGRKPGWAQTQPNPATELDETVMRAGPS